MLRKGMQVMLVGLQSNPDLNKKLGELGAYLHDSQRWVVELPCGRKLKVREKNMHAIQESVQLFYRAFGYPDHNTPLLADLVEIRTDEHGRRLFAKQAISKKTFARDDKVCVSMNQAESNHLGMQYDALCGAPMSTLLSKEIILPMAERSWNVAASYVGKCVEQGWLENALVSELMDYNCYSQKILQETIERMHVEDFFWHLFWVKNIADVPADTLWRLQCFLMSHGFLRDRTLVVGRSSYAQCTDERWKSLLAMRRGKKPKPITATGNFMEMPCWLVRPPQDGQIHVNECIVFHEDIRAGEELLVDYEEHYFPAHHKQLRNVCPPEMLLFLLHIVRPLDPRVTEALEAHMRGTQ